MEAFLATGNKPEVVRSPIKNGIAFEDGIYLKKFLSFSEEANIVRIPMDKLPFLPAVQLKKETAEHFSFFGDVLEHRIFKTENGIFQRGRIRHSQTHIIQCSWK